MLDSRADLWEAALVRHHRPSVGGNNMATGDWDQALAQLLGKDQTPDVMGEVYGWRSWYVYQQGSMVRLASLKSGWSRVNEESLWTPGMWQEAECWQVEKLARKAIDMGVRPDHAHTIAEATAHKDTEDGGRLPVESCVCGFYAAKDRDHLIKLGYNRYDNKDLRVIGEVGMSGKVIPAAQGWRAEKVRPVKLQVPFEKWKLAKLLEATYQVPVELANTWGKGQE